ncbi:MAG: sialidase family protein [Planctomycetaceae bacterium]
MRRRWFVPFVAVVVLLSGAAPALGVPAPTVVNVSKRPTNQAEEAVAVDPTNPQNVVIASNVEFGYGIFVGASHDGGATFARTVIGDKDRFGKACCDPTITWDASGNLYLGWLGYEGRSVPTVLTVVTSVDGGDHWSLFEDLAPPAPALRVRAAATVPARETERGGGLDQPTLTTGHRMLWAIWSQQGVLQAVGARIRGLGDTSPFKKVHDVPHTKNCTFGDISIGPSGQVLQVCQRNVPNTRPPRSVLRTNIDRDGLGPKTFSAGKIVARTRVSLFEAIPAQRKRTIDAEAGLAWDTSGGPYAGRLYLMYTDERPDQSNDTDVWVMTSDDDGGTWTTPARVEQEPRSQFLPKIALDPTTGDVAVSFHDASLDTGGGPPYDTDGEVNTDATYAIAFSADGGATWSTPLMVSQGASNAADARNQVDYGDYSGLAFYDGVAHPAWADNSNSTGDNPDGTLSKFDVYTAAVAG